MINWFKKNKTDQFPDFWKEYLNSFSVKPTENMDEVRFVVLDTETTGFNYRKDRILSIGAVSVLNNSIDVTDSFEVYVQQEKFNPKTVEIHGLLKKGKLDKTEEEYAIKTFVNYLGNSIIVAHHAHFDVTMINYALKRLGLPKLKNKVLDTGVLYKATRLTSNLIDKEKNYTLDELANSLDISVKDRHTASGDAYITAIAFMKITSKLKLKLKPLFRL